MIPNTGTIFASLRKMLCWIKISRIVFFLVRVFSPYGINLISFEASEDVLYSKFLFKHCSIL